MHHSSPPLIPEIKPVRVMLKIPPSSFSTYEATLRLIGLAIVTLAAGENSALPTKERSPVPTGPAYSKARARSGEERSTRSAASTWAVSAWAASAGALTCAVG